MHLHQLWVLWPCKNISHIQVSIASFFPTPPIKLELELQIGGRRRLLIANHLDQSNYLPNQKQQTNKQGAVKKHSIWLCLLLDCSQGSSRDLKTVHFVQGPSKSSSGFTGFDQSTSSKVSSESHILSIGGDALTKYRPGPSIKDLASLVWPDAIPSLYQYQD
jgi:hypothetical protein